MNGTTQQVERLRDQIRSARESILYAIVRMDEIRLRQIPRIQVEYALKLGGLEQELLEAELSCRRERHRLAFAKAQVEGGLAPQMDLIERELDEELSPLEAMVAQARKDYERALALPVGPLAPSSAKLAELRGLYQRLVRRLHPSVNGGEGNKRTTFFLLAQAAYQNGATEALRTLEVATRHLGYENRDLDAIASVDGLAQELELTLIEEGVVRERLHELLDCEEMRLGRLLSNQGWVKTRTAELCRSIEERHSSQSACAGELKALLRNCARKEPTGR